MGRHFSKIALVAVAWGWLSGGALAAARDLRIHLEIVPAAGAPGCPDQAALRSRIVAQVGHDPFVPIDEADRILTASFDSSKGAIAATLSLRTSEGKALGEQQLGFTDPSCPEAAAAVALAIAMAVDPPSSIDSGFATPVPPPVPAAPPPPASAEPAKSGPAVEATVGALLVYQAEPHATLGITVGIGLRWQTSSLGLELRGDVPTGFPVDGGSVHSGLIFGTLAPCLRSHLFGGCLLVGVGVERASGEQLSPSNQATSPYGALGARGFVDLQLARSIRLRPELDLWFPVTRTTLVVADSSVWVTPPASIALGAALVIDL